MPFRKLIPPFTLTDSRLGVENKFFPSKLTFVTTQNHLYIILLCYKDRKDTIVPGGCEPIYSFNLSVLSLCLKERSK